MKKQKIKIHPVIKDLQKAQYKALKGKYYFAIKPIDIAIK